MVNNIGKTSKTLNTTLGETTPFNSSDDIIIITGEIGLGLLVFDTDGTLGAVSSFVSEEEFDVTTYAKSIDIQTILNLQY